MSYTAFITRVKNIRKHSNADRLNVGECFGNQVIVDLETNEGTIGVYFPSDGQLSKEYCAENNLVRRKDEAGNEVGGYLDPGKRNIRALKLRGEISDGLFMPLYSLDAFTDTTELKEGDLIDTLDGVEICRKYIPTPKKIGTAAGGLGSKSLSGNAERKLSFPMFHEHADTAQLAYNMHYFKPGMICYVTLKMHGTSARTGYCLRETSTPKWKLLSFLDRFIERPLKYTKAWEYISGTRRVVLDNSYEGGFYGNNNFRKVYHDLFEGKLRKGETVYYEIVGYEPGGRSIMGIVSNEKTRDKEFIKKYGKHTTYNYGCAEGENDIYVYRITSTNEDGDTVEYPWDLIMDRCDQLGVKHTPELDRFIFTTQEDMMKRMNLDIEAADPIGVTHIREGHVIRVEGKEKFKAFKHKGFYFKLLEGIIKDDGFLDPEEAQSVDAE